MNSVRNDQCCYFLGLYKCGQMNSVHNDQCCHFLGYYKCDKINVKLFIMVLLPELLSIHTIFSDQQF